MFPGGCNFIASSLALAILMGCDPLVFLEIPLFPGSFFLVFLHSLHSVTLLSLAQSGGGERKEENQEENQEAKKKKKKKRL